MQPASSTARSPRVRWAAFALGLAAALAAAASSPAQPPAPLRIQVTGGPAPVGTLALAILTDARVALGVDPDAGLSLERTSPPLRPLGPGDELQLSAVLRVTSPGAPPAVRTASVVLTNAVLPWSDAEALLVSNSPETLPFGKVLYRAALSVPMVVRLLYHHQNGSASQRMILSVTLSNPTAGPVTAWVSGAAAGPAGDEVTPGHVAAREFLDQYVHHAGFLIAIPRNTTVPVFLHAVGPREIVSGVAQVGVLSGDRLNLQVTARMTSELDPPESSYAPTFDRIHQRGAFPRPRIARSLTYQVGGPPAAMTLGDEADLLVGGQPEAPLGGNYGVVYEWDVTLSNPTAAAADVVFSMHAMGGQARSTVLFGDHLIESPLVQPNAPQVIATLRLGPQTYRTLRLVTIPESGSNYPVRFLLGGS